MSIKNSKIPPYRKAKLDPDYWSRTLVGESSNYTHEEEYLDKMKKSAEEFNKGVKDNKGKPKLSLLFKQFPRALKGVALLSEYGHEKYKESDEDYQNFSRVENSYDAYKDAELRHLADYYEKGEIDEESEFNHLVHKAWNALADLEIKLREE